MNVADAVIARKSIRSYTDQQVSEADVATIVEAGRWAPNAGAYTISVVRDPALLSQIDQLTTKAMLASGNDFLVERASLPGYHPIYGAPVLFVLSGPADGPYTQFNVAVAAENMLLQATELGLGSCFLRSLTAALNAEENSSLAAQAGIPEGSKAECGVVVGYTDDEDKFRRLPHEMRGTVVFID